MSAILTYLSLIVTPEPAFTKGSCSECHSGRVFQAGPGRANSNRLNITLDLADDAKHSADVSETVPATDLPDEHSPEDRFFPQPDEQTRRCRCADGFAEGSRFRPRLHRSYGDHPL